MFVSPQAHKHYADMLDRTYVYKYSHYKNLKRHSITAHCAIDIAHSLGAVEYTMLCFDAFHDRTCGYGEVVKTVMIKPEKKHAQQRFIKFAKDLENIFLKGLKHNWVKPEPLDNGTKHNSNPAAKRGKSNRH